MTVVIISKINWGVVTMRNVTSISLSSYTYTIVGDTTATYSQANYYIRIMES